MVAVVALLVSGGPWPAHAELDFPARARAALHIFPERVRSQRTADRVFGLEYLLGLYTAPELLGARAERFTLYTVQSARGWTAMGVTRAAVRLAQDFEKMRGTRSGSAGGHALYTYRSAAGGRVALVGHSEIAEGTEEALRLALEVPGSGAQAKARRALERSLRRMDDPGVAATLVYVAPPDGSTLTEVVTDLGAIWGPHLAKSIEPYEYVLGLLGSMRAARADVWQEKADLGVSIVLVAADAGAAKRSHLALRTARGLAPMVSKAAVSSGSMAQADADALSSVLRSMESRVEDDRIYVTLRVPGSIVQ
jgi:hypothetical protein